LKSQYLETEADPDCLGNSKAIKEVMLFLQSNGEFRYCSGMLHVLRKAVRRDFASCLSPGV